MRRPLNVVRLHLVAAAVSCGLLLGTPTANAALLFDAGTGGGAALVSMTRLPTWVQVTSASAPLYANDSSEDVAGSKLGRNAFLRVLGGGISRLQVDVYDESGRPGRRGWIDADDVQPSAPGIDWLVTARATGLFRGSASGDDPLRTLAAFTPLQVVDGPVADRIEVRVYRSDFGSGVLDQAWVDVSDTGPALAPQVRVASQTERSLTARDGSTSAQPRAFLDQATSAARSLAATTRVPASVTVAQAILESDWGRSTLARGANNYFGIKAIGRLGNDGVVWIPTSEYDDAGDLYQTVSPFRAYRSLIDSMTDYDRLLGTTSRYAQAMQASNDPREFAELLYEAGYSTDQDYAQKLVALMDAYDLYRLDR